MKKPKNISKVITLNKKRILRSFFSLLIIILFVFTGVGCSANDSTKTNFVMVQRDFFTLLQEKRFDELYELLSDDTKKTMTQNSFVTRYKDVFTKLGNDTTVLIKTDKEFSFVNSVYQTMNFTMTYSSPIFGELTDDYTLSMVRNGDKWRVIWTPAMIFPSMTWSDTLHVATKKPTRGEIFASDQIVAANQPGQTIYANPKKIQNLQSFAATIAPFTNQTSDKIIAQIQKSKLLGRVTSKTLNIRQQPSSEEASSVLLTLNQGESFLIKDQGTITAPKTLTTASDASKSSSITEQDGFYHVLYQNGTEEVEGYAYAPYIETYYSQDIVVLASFPPDTLNQSAIETILSVPGANIDQEGMSTYRMYPYKESMFHLVGYVSEITENQYEEYKNTELATYYPIGSQIGQTGIERQYDLQLRGRDGKELYINNYDNSNRRILYKQEAINGEDVYLTIDPNFQKYAYDLLRLTCLAGQAGAITINDPLTGAVHVATSYPSLDPNSFYTMSNEEWKWINLEDITRPFFNRALNAQYPPGSIIKPFTAIMAFDEGKITADTSFPYPDDIVDDRWMPSVAGWMYPAVKRIENKHSAAYQLTFENSMAYSDNIYFAWVAMQLDPNYFLDYYHNILGFEEKIPFDLPMTQASVFLEKQATGSEPLTDNDVFNLGFLASSGYGQGKMTVSPLYATMLFGGLANDGDIMKPYIVESLRRVDGEKYWLDAKTAPRVWKSQMTKNQTTLEIVNNSLVSVMTYGTGVRVKSPFKLAGKTGTAQRGSDDEVSWLSVFKMDEPHDFCASIAIETKANESFSRYTMMSALTAYYQKNGFAKAPENTDGFGDSVLNIEAKQATASK